VELVLITSLLGSVLGLTTPLVALITSLETVPVAVTQLAAAIIS